MRALCIRRRRPHRPDQQHAHTHTYTRTHRPSSSNRCVGSMYSTTSPTAGRCPCLSTSTGSSASPAAAPAPAPCSCSPAPAGSLIRHPASRTSVLSSGMESRISCALHATDSFLAFPRPRVAASSLLRAERYCFAFGLSWGLVWLVARACVRGVGFELGFGLV